MKTFFGEVILTSFVKCVSVVSQVNMRCSFIGFENNTLKKDTSLCFDIIQKSILYLTLLTYILLFSPFFSVFA